MCQTWIGMSFWAENTTETVSCTRICTKSGESSTEYIGLLFCAENIILSTKLSKRYRVKTRFTVEREVVDGSKVENKRIFNLERGVASTRMCGFYQSELVFLIWFVVVTNQILAAKKLDISTQKPKKKSFFLPLSYHHTEILPLVFPILIHCRLYTQC